MYNPALLIIIVLALSGIFIYLKHSANKERAIQQPQPEFPATWRKILEDKVIFYTNLDEPNKTLFVKRIQMFLASKKIEPVDTDIDDSIRLMVAASAIIPTFAFPAYNYPHVNEVLIYPNSFDKQFQTQRYKGHEEFISGMVGDRFMNGTVILSKPDLIMGFSGHPNTSNVGIHEFVHLLDKEDGAVDGVPEALITKPFVGPWLHEIKEEMKRIEKGSSDINPYALTNNAEFLAVVSEYFFDNPEKFKKRHPELYNSLSAIFNTGSGNRA
jgi:Mlc titration factor MtfA (ptsG expression regulator)